MKRMLIAAHARFADGLESALSLIMGKREDITCINAFVTETPLEKQIDDYAESLGEGDQVLVITDAFFGSVNQKIVPYAVRENVFLVAGFNLPLLVALAIAPEGITKDGIKQYIEDSRNQMELVELVNQEGQDEDFFG